MKKKELKKNLWEKFFSFVFLLLVFLPARAVAADASDLDINLTWGQDAKYEWQANKSRLKITFKFWDGQYRDDWIHNKKNNGTDGGITITYAGKTIFHVTGGYREGGSWKTHSLHVKNNCTVGEVYVDNSSNLKWSCITNYEGDVAWPATGSGAKNEGWATIYYYPNDDNMNRKSAVLRIQASVTDSQKDLVDYDDTDFLSTTPLDYKLSEVLFSGWESTGTFPVTVIDLENGDADSYTKSDIKLQTSTDNKTWYTQHVYSISSTKNFKHTFEDAEYIKYPKRTTDVIGYEQFATGIYFRVLAETDPDYGSGTYIQKYTSSTQKTQPIAVLKNKQLKIDHTINNELYFVWDVYKPSGYDVLNNWSIEELQADGTWSTIHTLECINGKNSYTYPLNLEKERQAITKTYRVRNTVFDAGCWQEYVCTNHTKITYHPYYQVFQSASIRVDPKAEERKAILSWERTQNGVWNGDISLTVEYYNVNDGEIKTKELSFSDKTCTLQNLSECTEYHVSVIAANEEENFADTISTTFIMPDAGKHEIANFEATRGYYSHKVRLKWDVEKGNTFNSFEIKRRAIHESATVSIAELSFNASNTVYSYEDMNVEAGEIYEYTIIGYTNCTDNAGEEAEDVHADAPTCYGFAQSYASVSGRIYFNGDQGVPGVDVAIVGSEDYTENYSLEFNSDGSYLSLPADVIDFRNDNSITFQMYVYPLAQKTDTAYICTHKGIFELALVKLAEESNQYALINNIFKNQHIDTLAIDNWHHITMAIHVDKNSGSVKADYYSNGQLYYSQSHENLDIAAIQAARDSIFMIGVYADTTKNFKGNIDEIRVWNRILDSAYVAKTYNRYISGREADLRAYYRCDEPSVNVVFDYSGKDDLFNKRDGIISATVGHSDKIIPSSEQLANKAITDEDGNYIINTIPYTTEGQQYEVVPMLGIHQFSPNKQPIYVSASSTVFNKIDFIDKSSFEVSGKVYYENSDYPVAGCQLQVDGSTCMENNKPILTNSDGEFTIHVPIGEHYITVVKDGHEFEHAGRYPADTEEEGLLYDFQQPVSNLIFTDITKANLTGRIAGGMIEYRKTYAGRQSQANMGQAKIVLEASDLYSLNARRVTNEASTSFEINSQPLYCDSVHPDIQSRAFIGGAQESNLITIYTDSITGEFAVKLPPVQYEVKSITIPTNSDIIFDMETIEDIDLRDVTSVRVDTSIYKIDSILYDIRTISYVDELKPLYRSEPTFIVTQKNHADGSFGAYETIYEDPITGKKDTVILYTNIADSISYTFGYPIFEQQKEYTFNLEGYEQYVNYDLPNDPQISKVPLRYSLVTIANEFGIEQAVDTATGKLWDELEEGQLYLDSLGMAEYVFMVGFPNLVEPYTYGLSIKYNVDGKEYLWNNKPLEAIVLGNVPGGNQFVTGGPDIVTMILRDPPGTQSSSYFEEGAKSVETHSWNWNVKANVGFLFSKKTKLEMTEVLGDWTGVGAGGFWGMVTQDFAVGSNHDHTITGDVAYKGNNTTTTTTVLNKRVSTSSTVAHIGATGDVFIGCATNMLFGEAREVMVTRDTLGQYQIGVVDVVSAGEKFTTTFQYSQSYIISTLIPNLKEVRNSFLVTADTTVAMPSSKSEPIYVTPLSPDDPNFGTEGTYKVIYPDSITAELSQADTISIINSQIESWKSWLALNEQEKVEAIKKSESNDTGKKNYSFDSGTTITEVIQNVKDTSITHGVDFGINYKAHILFAGKKGKREWDIDFTVGIGVGASYTDTNIDGHTTTTAFTLADADLYNSYSVDIIPSATEGRSAIFYTRGGQTSCPWAREEKTQFYEAGKHKLAEATVQIEKPQIRVEQPFATDVPTGQPAKFTIMMDNLSETNSDLMFDLCVLDESNPNGARIAIDGEGLVGNRPIRIRAGETMVKTVMLRQSDLGVLDYKDILLVLKSQCQGGLQFSNIIADTVAISASFTPSCSDIELEINNRILNTSTGAVLPIKVKGYNMQYSNFQGFRLQYKGEHDVDWTMIGEWLLDAQQKENAHLLETGEINYQFDMSDNAFTPDGTYQFRALTICNYGTGEINNESETIEVIKDMTQPMLFGLPSPASGILSATGEISVTFNEEINTSLLTNTRNFLVEGRPNGYKVEHQVAMLLQDGVSAKTTTDMLFSATPFAINCWFNYTQAGDIITFGNANNKLIIGLNDIGQMVITLNQQTTTSVNSIPNNKWGFLSITYDTIAGGIFIADYIVDDQVINLFDGEAIGQCNSVKSQLVLGGNLTAMMHELTIWNYARSIEEAQSEMYTAKNASTAHLVCYWRMDDGYGNMAEDIAQGHHLILPNEYAWYLSDENLAAQLNGETAMLINTSTISPTPQEDYLLELWVNPAMQANDAVLLSNGLGFQLGVNAQGELSLKTTQRTLTHAITPNVWHHVAINHRHSGSTVLYLDGNEVFQVSNESMPNLAADHLVIGADRYLENDSTTKWSYRNYFTGTVDEVRFWKATMTANYMRKLYRTRIYGDEAGLVAYYPFEKTILNDFAQPETHFDLADHSQKEIEDLQIAAGEAIASEQTPPLKSISLLENIKYSYVADGRKIIISFNDEAEHIEGTTVFLTVQNVEDLNGNIAEPINWAVVVSQNQLKWIEKSHEITVENNHAATFETTIVNQGAEREYWQLKNIPTWLSVDKEYGELHTLTTEQISFTVSETLPIGTYEETIYLVGNNNIYEPFVVRVVVTGKQPTWIVRSDDYEYSMNIIGSLIIEGVASEDANDIIAAFVNDECVGVASPQYNQRYDKYFVMMDIYSNVSQSNTQSVVFKVYDASTGNIYPIVQLIEPDAEKPTDALIFENNSLIGSLDKPLVWDVQNYLEQVVDFNENWNWFSLYVNPTDTIASTLFESMFPNLILLKNKISSMIFDGRDFVGKDLIIKAGEMFRAKLSEKKRYTFIGTPVDLRTYQDTISPNWTWIGYPASFTMSITDAFASINPQHGDIVKSKSNFAAYSGYEWIGTLNNLVPGQGYMYYSTDQQSKILQFPAQTITRNMLQRQDATSSNTFTPVDNNLYPSNMTVIAKVYNGEELQLEAEVAAFVGDECRGVATTNENGFVCLTIAGEGAGDQIVFRVLVGNEIYTIDQTITYEDDAILGSISQPYTIQLSAITNVENTKITSANIYTENGMLVIEGAEKECLVYDMLGRIMYVGGNTRLYLPTGIYIVQLGTEIQRVIL